MVPCEKGIYLVLSKICMWVEADILLNLPLCLYLNLLPSYLFENKWRIWNCTSISTGICIKMNRCTVLEQRICVLIPFAPPMSISKEKTERRQKWRKKMMMWYLKRKKKLQLGRHVHKWLFAVEACRISFSEVQTSSMWGGSTPLVPGFLLLIKGQEKQSVQVAALSNEIMCFRVDETVQMILLYYKCSCIMIHRIQAVGYLNVTFSTSNVKRTW